jgi:hypothetical protein
MVKANRKGRSKSSVGRFIMLPHYLLNSLAWRSLDPNQRCTFIEVLARFNGSNNGRLGMSARTLSLALNKSRTTCSRALKILCERGFLEVVKRSAFSVKSKLASEYRITSHRCDVTGKFPSKAFMKWIPENNTRPHSKATMDFVQHMSAESDMN